METPTLCLSGPGSFRRSLKNHKSAARDLGSVPTIILKGIVTRADMNLEEEIEVVAAEAITLA